MLRGAIPRYIDLGLQGVTRDGAQTQKDGFAENPRSVYSVMFRSLQPEDTSTGGDHDCVEQPLADSLAQPEVVVSRLRFYGETVLSESRFPGLPAVKRERLA